MKLWSFHLFIFLSFFRLKIHCRMKPQKEMFPKGMRNIDRNKVNRISKRFALIIFDSLSHSLDRNLCFLFKQFPFSVSVCGTCFPNVRR